MRIVLVEMTPRRDPSAEANELTGASEIQRNQNWIYVQTEVNPLCKINRSDGEKDDMGEGGNIQSYRTCKDSWEQNIFTPRGMLLNHTN